MAELTRQIRVRVEGDITRAIVETSQVARSLGFDAPAVNKIATATSELARNIIKYAGMGEILIREAADDRGVGIEIVARDRGPGIADVDTAMEDHFSSGGTLGLGLLPLRPLGLVSRVRLGLDPGQPVVRRLGPLGRGHGLSGLGAARLLEPAGLGRLAGLRLLRPTLLDVRRL